VSLQRYERRPAPGRPDRRGRRPSRRRHAAAARATAGSSRRTAIGRTPGGHWCGDGPASAVRRVRRGAPLVTLAARLRHGPAARLATIVGPTEL